MSRCLAWHLNAEENIYDPGFVLEMEKILIDLTRQAQQQGFVQNQSDPNHLAEIVAMMHSGNM